MLISLESSLRHIPVALGRKQAFFLEGIRVSLEMLDLVHTRLQSTLLALTDAQVVQQDLSTSAVADAWLIIDAFHRLADLAEHMPNVTRRNRIPFFRNLIQANETVNELRNTVQHLPGTIHELTVAPNWSVWGALSWCVPPSDDRSVIRIGSYYCGKITPGERPLINPIGQRVRRPVGLITLSQGGVSISLSELYGHAEQFALEFERMTKRIFGSDPRLTETYISDVLVLLDMVEEEEPPAGQASGG
jgi:hypothetical protein